MIIRYTTLRNLGVVVVLAAFCALLYVHFFRPRLVGVPYPVAVAEPELARLSTLVDNYIDAIFSPLDGKVPPIPHQELQMLRERFADSLPKVSPAGQPMYQTAVQLCDGLLAAIQERERSSVSLADTRSKPYGAALSGDAKKEQEDKRRFFEFGIIRRWADNSKSYRDKVDRLYSQLRAEERDRRESSRTDYEQGGTIVLQHPTTVHLHYGNATLPAGLSLRVLDRTVNGIIVEYAGEQVTLPRQ